MTTTSKMKTYSFSLVVTPPGDVKTDEELAEVVYGAGCHDCLVSVSNRFVFVHFDRQSKSLADAVSSAIKQLEKSGVKAKLFNGSRRAKK